MRNPKLILISGHSGAGKTTICKKLIDSLKEKETLSLEVEKYFIPYNKRERTIYGDDNSPYSYYLSKLVEDVKNAIDSKVFDYIVVEGNLALYDDNLNELTDYRVFVDCDEEERFTRKIQANLEAGISFDDLTNIYLDVARYRHNQFVEMSKTNATLIVSGEKDVAVTIKEILDFVQ